MSERIGAPATEGPSACAAALVDRLSRIWALAEEAHAGRPDLQAAFPDTGSDGFWLWMNTSGRAEYPALGNLLVPLPPPRVRALVGRPDEADFLHTGASMYSLLSLVSREFGPPFAAPAAVLEFGCGLGSGLRYLLKHAGTLTCTGTDADAIAVGWCGRHFPFGELTLSCDIPPTDFSSHSFDLIFATSAFSQLAEDHHLAWLSELRRLAKPGGVVVLTIHGEHALRRTLAEPNLRQLLSLAEPDLAAVQTQLASRRYAFVRQGESPQSHGRAFIRRDYVLRRWSREFDVATYLEAAIGDWQDAVVLRAPGSLTVGPSR